MGSHQLLCFELNWTEGKFRKNREKDAAANFIPYQWLHKWSWHIRIIRNGRSASFPLHIRIRWRGPSWYVAPLYSVVNLQRKFKFFYVSTLLNSVAFTEPSHHIRSPHCSKAIFRFFLRKTYSVVARMMHDVCDDLLNLKYISLHTHSSATRASYYI